MYVRMLLLLAILLLSSSITRGDELVSFQCKDIHPQCWLVKQQNLCSTTKVQERCQRSCNRCPQKFQRLVQEELVQHRVGSLERDVCEDAVSWCRTYSSYCPYDNVVKKYCKKTCQLCSNTRNDVNCADKHSQCAYFPSYNLCTRYGDRLCPLTCGFCSKSQCGVAPLNPLQVGRIVNGAEAGTGFFPWQVGIYLRGNFHCGGALIGTRYFLSAAHCFDGQGEDYRQMAVKVGDVRRDVKESTEQEFNIEVIQLHPHYDKEKSRNDIVVGKLSAAVTTDNHVATICLPERNEDPRVGSSCTISGWGKSYAWGRPHSTLQYITSPIVSEETCRRRNEALNPITDTNICTGSTDGSSFESACHGDSGGPLSCPGSDGTWKLHGVVSWGDPQCNAMNKYNVFTRVSRYVDWIRSAMR